MHQLKLRQDCHNSPSFSICPSTCQPLAAMAADMRGPHYCDDFLEADDESDEDDWYPRGALDLFLLRGTYYISNHGLYVPCMRNIYIHIYSEIERERERGRLREGGSTGERETDVYIYI